MDTASPHQPPYSFINTCAFFSHRGLDSVVRWQHVHEGGDTKCHAHRGRGRLPPFHVPAGVWPPHGRHVPRVSRHIEAGAGQWKGQTDGQPRYRINRPVGSPLVELGGKPYCFSVLFFCYFSLWSRPDNILNRFLQFVFVIACFVFDLPEL